MNTAKSLHTLNGPVEVASLGLALPHEHLFTDLRGPFDSKYAQADPSAVAKVVKPYLDQLVEIGVTALVECSTVGVGRNLSVLRKLQEITSVHIVAPTGVYRDACIPAALREITRDDLADLWARELTEGIEGTPVRAGFIKLAVSDEGLSELEVRNLRAAVKASLRTGAVIAVHTIGGDSARKEMDILEGEGLSLDRYVWVHAQTEPDASMLVEAARRGAYVELDAVGAPFQSQPELLETALKVIQAGHIERLLLSHDAGWYDPSTSGGRPKDGYRGYTALVKDFIPSMLRHGISEEQVRQITVHNPARAFAF
jgi:phosphotriesterase-related protein